MCNTPKSWAVFVSRFFGRSEALACGKLGLRWRAACALASDRCGSFGYGVLASYAFVAPDQVAALRSFHSPRGETVASDEDRTTMQLGNPG